MPLISQLFITAALLVLSTAVNTLAQDPKDQEVRPLLPEIESRIQLYYELRHKKDWARLFEIDDWQFPDKDDYIKMHVADENNPYVRVKNVLQMRVNNSMRYWESSRKWEIVGCARFVDKEGKEHTASGKVWAKMTVDRGWIIGDALPAWYGDGWRNCTKPLTKFPVGIVSPANP